MFLQLWVNGLVLHPGILQEGPKLLQSVELTWTEEEAAYLIAGSADLLKQLLMTPQAESLGG